MKKNWIIVLAMALCLIMSSVAFAAPEGDTAEGEAVTAAGESADSEGESAEAPAEDTAAAEDAATETAESADGESAEGESAEAPAEGGADSAGGSAGGSGGGTTETADGPSADAPEPGVEEGVSYVSEYLAGASAIYVSGESKTFDNTTFYGMGYATSEDITAQIPNQYGMCAVVLAAGQGTEVVMNNPVIKSDPSSYSNGVFAAAMAKVTINGGSIETNNSSGHGIDTTYMGHVYVKDATIYTHGETSGALASDFGGGYINGENLTIRTDGGSSPGIFSAGSTIIMLKDSTIDTASATGVVVAHDHAVVVLDNVEVNAAGTALNGLQALPSPESSEGSRAFVFGGTLNSKTGAVIGEGGGRTEANLIGVACNSETGSAISVTSGIMTVNLWDTELTGSITCSSGNSLTINIYSGATLTGDVSGDGEIVINVYDGGAYNGNFEATEAGEGVEAPVVGTFDDYLMSDWASGSLSWQGSTVTEYVETIEPRILENSAATYAENSTAYIEYDPESYDPSENGVDLAVLSEKSAHGFTYDEVFGGAESRTGATGDSSGESAEGESDSEAAEDAAAEAPAEGESAEGESADGESADGEAPADGESAEGESDSEAAEDTAAEAPAEG